MSLDEFLNMICETLEMEYGSININDSTDTIKEWDSLGHLSILVNLDSIGVDTSKEEFREFDTIIKLAEILRKEGILKD